LTVEVEFRCPPGFDAVFEFESGGDKRIAGLGTSRNALGFDLEIAGLFEFVRVGDEVVFLGMQARDDPQHRQQEKTGQAQCARATDEDSK